MTQIREYRSQDVYVKIAKSITGNLDITQVLEAISEEIRAHFQPENWCLLRVDRTSQEMFFMIAEGQNSASIQHHRIAIDQGIAGAVVTRGEPVIVKDTEHDPRFNTAVDKLSGFQTRSIIAVPILYHGDVLGVIELINSPRIDSFSDLDLTLLATIADFSAIALINSTLYSHAKLVAATDALTGVYNRTKLAAVVDEWKIEHTQAKQSKEEDWFVSVYAVDLNDFKKVNDTLGHREGDRVLCQTADLLRGCVRSKDMVFRTGGDEFLLFINYLNGNEPVMNSIAGRVTHAIDEGSRQLLHGCSFSYGQATGPYHRIDGLIHQADGAMYDFKKESKKGR